MGGWIFFPVPQYCVDDMTSILQRLASARTRFAALHQRALAQSPELADVLDQSMREVQQALDEIQLAQDHMLEQRDRLQMTRVELQREREKYWQLFDGAPEPYLVTTVDLQIVDANRAAAAMFNISQRFLAGKSLGIFVCKDRDLFVASASRIGSIGGFAEWTLTIRPRERAPLDVQARVVVSSGYSTAPLHWTFIPGPSHAN